MKNIRNKTVVLTGASGGIGRSVAQKLSAEGARLILVARNEQNLTALLDDLGGRPHMVVAADLGDAEGRCRLLEFCENLNSGGVDVLVNNAGINELSLFEEQSQAAITNVININLVAPMLVCQDLLPLLRKQKDARIVNIGSTFGSIGYPGFGAYCASKFGLRGFTESLRRELADTDLKVSYIAPRATQTDFNSDSIVAMNDALGTVMDKPSVVADAVVKIINTSAGVDKYLGWPEKLFVRINALLPALVDSNLRKQLPIIRRFAKHGI
jgi:short-subunit dehydrogenase